MNMSELAMDGFTAFEPNATATKRSGRSASLKKECDLYVIEHQDGSGI
jgi:hypothetical protein